MILVWLWAKQWSMAAFWFSACYFNHQGSKNLRDLFPEPPSSKDVPNCSFNGVLGTLPGMMGDDGT
jgi:adenylyltransferase/sulfurtransferase